MKDYNTTIQEIKICRAAINHLIKKKERLLARATRTTTELKQDISSGGQSSNAIETYVQKLIDSIEEDLIEKQAELRELLKTKEKIKRALKIIARNKNNDLERIFVYKYIDGLSNKEIANLMPCDLSTVYRKLDEIKTKI